MQCSKLLALFLPILLSVSQGIASLNPEPSLKFSDILISFIIIQVLSVICKLCRITSNIITSKTLSQEIVHFSIPFIFSLFELCLEVPLSSPRRSFIHQRTHTFFYDSAGERGLLSYQSLQLVHSTSDSELSNGRGRLPRNRPVKREASSNHEAMSPHDQTAMNTQIATSSHPVSRPTTTSYPQKEVVTQLLHALIAIQETIECLAGNRTTQPPVSTPAPSVVEPVVDEAVQGVMLANVDNSSASKRPAT